MNRLLIKIQHKDLPQIKDRYPFLYLERGRLEIDDSSVKWIDCTGNIIRLPIATIGALLLGPGTSVTHEAIKVLASANCTVCWVGEDSLLFYAVGQSPTADSRNFRKQIELATNPEQRIEVAKRMFLFRFPKADIKDKSLQELMGMEGRRVHKLYEDKAEKYHVGWKGRSYIPGKFELGTITNQILTAANAALYALISSSVYSLGFSPQIGFVHTGSPLPFVYDIADLYKENLCIDLAFQMTRQLGGNYQRQVIADEFRKRVIDSKLLEIISKDIYHILGIIKK